MITNTEGLPNVLVEAVKMDPYNPGESDITATKLIGPPQIHYLLQHHEVTEDVTDRIWALLGQGVHEVIERTESDQIAEWRLYADMEGWRISGQVDRMNLDDGGDTLVDYKITSAWTHVYSEKGYREEWEEQLNVLAWLAEQNGANIQSLSIVVIYRDWQRSKANDDRYPSKPAQRIEIPLWRPEKRENYVRERVRLHQQAHEGKVTPCTPDEQWARKDQWAVKKDGRKSAVRVFDSPERAEQYAEDVDGEFWIEHRPGERIRCESYCPVRDFCKQYRMEQNDETVPSIIHYQEGQ